MAFNYNSGIHNVGSYQVSGRPFVTGSEAIVGQEYKINFPKVTKSITVIFSGSAGAKGINGVDLGDTDCLRVYFARTASQDPITPGERHYITLGGHGESVTFDIKCKEIFIGCVTEQANEAAPYIGYEVFAELTNIDVGSMYSHTGSGISHAWTGSW